MLLLSCLGWAGGSAPAAWLGYCGRRHGDQRPCACAGAAREARNRGVLDVDSTASGDSFSARYTGADEARRREFDRELAGYFRGHHERWDLTAIVEPLDLLGRKVAEVGVRLHRSATGRLSVTIDFELAPARAGPGQVGGRRRQAG